jgi:pilus assembly protein CpaE
MHVRSHDSEITALLVAPHRVLAEQFLSTLTETRAFQILADLRSYPPRQTLEIRVRQLKPEVVLLDIASDLDEACDLLRFLTTLNPPVHAVGLHTHNDSNAILKSLRAGAAEFLYAPFDPATQREALARLHRLRKPDVSLPTQTTSGNVVVFASTQPGSGASTLATQTAFAIQRQTGRKVLLVDGDLTGGTIGFYLKLSHSFSLLDALQQGENLDSTQWSSLTVNYGGVDILPAPALPYADSIDPTKMRILVDHARQAYDWVILDCPSIFNRGSLLAVSEADRAFLISTSELPSLHLTRKAMTLIAQIGFPLERFMVVVNRMEKREGIGKSDMEKLFGRPVHATLPNDYFALHRVVTLGQPLGGDGELGRAIENLTQRLCTAMTKKSAVPQTAIESKAVVPLKRA